MNDRWLSLAVGMVWRLERALTRVSLQARGMCPDCRGKNKVHPITCPRQGGPGRRLWSQGG